MAMPFLDQERLGGEGCREWTQSVFRQAWVSHNGPFERVCERLALGFSVLVYLPGSCMDAAADFVQDRFGGRPTEPGGEDDNCKRSRWRVYGNHPGDGKTMEEAWLALTGVIEPLTSWFTGSDSTRPDVIYKNMDRLFLDNNDGVCSHPNAQVALFSLIECTRGARTLGLVDRDYGPLPDAVEAPFAEKVWLREIDVERFAGLIPIELAEHLVDDTNTLDPGIEWLLASRLRWLDPMRAAMVMRSVGVSCSDELSDVLTRVWEQTRPIDFDDADTAFPGDPDAIQGVPKTTLDLLRSAVIGRYRRWLKVTGRSREESERELQKLPPGLILHGPPGTGKTYLAKWIAKSIGLPVRVVSGADVRDPRFGQTEKNIRRLFRDARRAAPCVVVLDDADDLLVARNEASGSVASAERAIVNTTLQELDGFEGRIAGVLVIMTTNRYLNLDDAVRSRLRLHVHVPYPITEEQIGGIVDTIAADYACELSDEVRDALVERFAEPVLRTAGGNNYATAEDREHAQSNLFSPREIQQAMLLLEPAEFDTQSDGCYRPSMEDVTRMKAYYELRARAFET